MTKSNRPPKIAIIIPAYNEGSVIADVISKMGAALRESSYEYEIVAVDDGSKDDTAKRAAEAGATVIKHILNCGSGGATATGLSYAQRRGFTIAATMDADGQHDPEDVLKGVRLIQAGGDDLVIGSRLIDNHGMSKV